MSILFKSLQIVSIIGLITGFFLLFYSLGPLIAPSLLPATPNPSTIFSKVPISTSSAQKLPSQGLPQRLKIPSINVDAVVEKVGLTSAGAMETPVEINDVGWYRLGPRPGESGSAVIDGHLNGNTWGRTGVFGELHKLKIGDLVNIEDEKGVTITFTVWKISTYNADEHVADVFSPTDGAYLNLVTCDGVWDNNKLNYTQRLVVFTRAGKTTTN